MSGYAWSSNVGWINFDPTDEQVTIDPASGEFDGFAWGENVGWIHFGNGSPSYKVRSAWRAAPATFPRAHHSHRPGGGQGAATGPRSKRVSSALNRVPVPGPVAARPMNDILAELAATLEARKGAPPQESYAASLYARGIDTILKKVGEEAVETIIAAKGEDDAALLHEVADLWFHTLVLLASRGLHPQQVLAELERRSGVSGHREKAARGGA